MTSTNDLNRATDTNNRLLSLSKPRSSLIHEVEKLVDNENRPASELYAELKTIGGVMYLSNRLSKDMVLRMCSDLIVLYEMLKGK